jgi:glycosyltransferase involved in cell wall biosynthesis
MPAVSVIMPAYNVAPYLGAAIESVLDQRFDDLELIVVDDGATDGSGDIAREYAARDERVRVIWQRNGGISAARNRGLREASAPVIALLDGDDQWSPGYLEAQLAILERHPDVDIVTGNAYFLGGRLTGEPARPYPDPRPTPALLDIIRDETAVFIMTVLRRRVADALGGFDETLRTNEDYDFWLRAALAGFRFHRNDTPLGHYRRRDDSLSASEIRMLRGLIVVYRKLRPQVIDRPEAVAAVDAQIARFEVERLAAEAREAIELHDYDAARMRLAALHQRVGGATLALARLLARWSPGLLARAYHARRARLARTRVRAVRPI